MLDLEKGLREGLLLQHSAFSFLNGVWFFLAHYIYYIFIIFRIYNFIFYLKMIGSFNKLLRNVASLRGKSAFDKVSLSKY